MIVPDLAAAQTGDMGGVLGSTGGRPGLGGPGGLGGTSPGGMADSYCEGKIDRSISELLADNVFETLFMERSKGC